MARRIALALLVVFLATGCFAQPRPKSARRPNRTNPAFEKMKTLVGEWTATYDGAPMTNTFLLIANGSALLHVESGGEQEVVTVFYPVGAQLRADHYCYLKNQPRFVARPSSDPNVISFAMTGISNIHASPKNGHMHSSTWRFIDPDHLIQEWHYYENGKEAKLFRLEFTRVK